jgi:hypothetical protein
LLYSIGEETVTIFLIVLMIIIIGSAIAGLICYRTLALPNMKPLTQEEIELCRGIVEKGKGYPWMCRHAVKTGKCACLPCDKLDKEKNRLSGN